MDVSVVQPEDAVSLFAVLRDNNMADVHTFGVGLTLLPFPTHSEHRNIATLNLFVVATKIVVTMNFRF